MSDDRMFEVPQSRLHELTNGLRSYAALRKALTEPSDQLVEHLCEAMHDAYEAAAVTLGWSTQEKSRKPWVDVPEANKATMRAAVRATLRALDGEVPS